MKLLTLKIFFFKKARPIVNMVYFFFARIEKKYIFLFAYIDIKIFLKETQKSLKGAFSLDGGRSESNFSLYY